MKHIKIQLINGIAQADGIVDCLSSLTTLTKLQGYMCQNRLINFLRQTQAAGPLQLVILEHLAPREYPVHLDEGLHRTVHDLMRRKVLSKFSHPAKCSCRRLCFIKRLSMRHFQTSHVRK